MCCPSRSARHGTPVPELTVSSCLVPRDPKVWRLWRLILNYYQKAPLLKSWFTEITHPHTQFMFSSAFHKRIFSQTRSIHPFPKYPLKTLQKKKNWDLFSAASHSKDLDSLKWSPLKRAPEEHLWLCKIHRLYNLHGREAIQHIPADINLVFCNWGHFKAYPNDYPWRQRRQTKRYVGALTMRICHCSYFSKNRKSHVLGLAV